MGQGRGRGGGRWGGAGRGGGGSTTEIPPEESILTISLGHHCLQAAHVFMIMTRCWSISWRRGGGGGGGDYCWLGEQWCGRRWCRPAAAARAVTAVTAVTGGSG